MGEVMGCELCGGDDSQYCINCEGDLQKEFDKYHLLKERIINLAADPELIDILGDIITLIERGANNGTAA